MYITTVFVIFQFVKNFRCNRYLFFTHKKYLKTTDIKEKCFV